MSISTRPKVFVTRRLTGTAIDRIAVTADVDVWDEDRPLSPEDFQSRVVGIDGLLTTSDDRVNAAILDHCPDLRVVANMASGYNNLDIPELTTRGIPASNTPGTMTNATADLTFALILACARKVVIGREALLGDRWKRWDPNFCLGLEVTGATIGIIGTGQIGQAVAKRARAFDMEILGWSRSERDIDGMTYVPLDELLSRADIVSLHVPLTPDTNQLINARTFKLMKPTALLINTARGQVVDQRALAVALSTGEIAAAGLDVYEAEPVPLDDPILALENCIALPHIGSATFGTRAAMANLAADNLLAGLDRKPLLNCVNPEVYGTKR